MNKSKTTKSSGVGYLINQAQTLFVGLLRIWTIPIVLALSVASGFTTFYGLSHFIIPWIAFVITIAIQSIIVICSLEIAGIHWKANRLRYSSVLLSLLIALTASISFSYFKFYEISQQDDIHITRLNKIRTDIKAYLSEIITVKNQIAKQQRLELETAAKNVSQAYFGTHPDIAPNYRNQVGEGRFWKHYKDIYEDKKLKQQQLETRFAELGEQINALQKSLGDLDIATDRQKAYYTMSSDFQKVQLHSNQIATQFGFEISSPPLLLTYKEFSQDITPSLAMWSGFSLFAFVCAAMVDFFTVLLSYRLEFTAPGPLSEEEEELVFECIRQFTEFRINKNDELEMVIEKSELEKARRYSDWSRMFAVGLLLNRGFLRKIDHRTVEFAPNIYPLIAEKMSQQIMQLKSQAKHHGSE